MNAIKNVSSDIGQSDDLTGWQLFELKYEKIVSLTNIVVTN